MLLFFGTAYSFLSSSSGTEVENFLTICGFRIPELAFLLSLWTLYHEASYLLIVSEDSLEFCKGEADKIFQEAARISFYTVWFMISLKRCTALLVARFEENRQSWGWYFASAVNWTKKCFLSFLFDPFLTFAILRN